MMMDIVRAPQWRQQTWRPLTPLTLPVGEFYVHHGASGTATLATLRAYERYHVRTLGWAAPGYGWAITGDGGVYELRGARVGAHTRGRNNVSVAVCLVGNWTTGTVPQPMVDSLAALTRHLHNTGVLRTPTITGGHREAPGQSTTCPGAGGMDAIRRARQLLANPPEDEDMPLSDDDIDRIIDRLLRTPLKDPYTGDELHVQTFLRQGSGPAREVRDALGGRNAGDDLSRLRRSVRAIGAKLGIPTSLEDTGRVEA